MRVQFRRVPGRTAGLRFQSVLSAPFPRTFTSGLTRLRVFQGTGNVMVCWTPFRGQYMSERMTGEGIEGSLFE